MAFNKNKKIVTTALTAAMVASAVAPVAAAKLTPAQDATKAVDGYYKLSVKTKADVSNSAKVKKAALAKVAKLTSKKDAKLKASLTAKVAKKSAAINKYYQTVIVAAENEAKAIAAVEAFLKLATETPVTAETTKEQVEQAYAQALALIAKVKTEAKKAEFKTAADKMKADALAKIEELATPKVASVTAINGKEIEIKFNKAIDKATVIEASGANAGTLVDGVFNFVALKKADGTTASNAVSADASTGSLSEDGKTLTVSANAGVFEGNYTVAVNKGVKTTAGVEVPAKSELLYVKDTTAPTLVSGSASAKVATKTITLKFSEPVSSTGAVAYINGAPAVLSAGSSANELTVTSASDIAAGTTVSVSVLNVTDAAGNVLGTNPSATSVTVTANTTAPTVSSVQVTGEKTFTATFTKPVLQSSFTNKVAVVTGGISPSSTAFTVSNVSADGKTVTFTTASPIFASASTFSGTLVIDKDVTDSVGNKLGADYSQSITFTKDTTAPAVTAVATDSTKSKVLVTFGKNVSLVGTPAATLAGVTLIDSTGAVVSLAAGATASVVNNNQLEISNNGVALAAGTYTVRLASELVTDGLTNSNKNVASTHSVTVTATASSDTAKPVVTTSNIVGGNNGAAAAPEAEQTLSYTVQDANSGIDINTILTLSNYTIDGKVLPTGTYITTSGYSAANKTGVVTVTLHLPSSGISASTTASQLVVSNLKDLVGNTITPAVSNAFALAEGVAPELSTVAIASGDNSTLVASMSEAVTGLAIGKTTVTLNGVNVTSAATLTAITAGPDKGKYYVQVAEKFDAAGTGTAYIDLDASGTLNAGDLTLATGVASAPAFVNFSSSAVSSLKVGLTTGTGVTDAQGNVAKTGTITVK